MSLRSMIGRALLSAAVLVLVSVIVYQLRSRPQGRPLASTRCTRGGPVLEVDRERIPEEDVVPVLAHEDVHAAQCRDLGWVGVRLRNLTASGALSLEAPGYCAGALARLRRGDDFAITRERMFDDANAMFAGVADSARVNAALRTSCPEIAASARR